MRIGHDDLGAEVALPARVRRVVSLVPSLTETLASVHPEFLVGATDWCTHPEDLSCARVRGTKNPHLAAVRALKPDLVVATKEENRELDVRRLRESGVAVWVCDVETVPGALASIRRLFYALGWEPPAWLAEAERVWGAPVPPPRARVLVPIWRDPWMVVGADTFAGDLLARLGWVNAAGAGALNPDRGRYPHVDPGAVAAGLVDAVLLPDEPYRFTADDGPEAFTVPTHLVDGRLLTWYGPSLLDAHTRLPRP